MPDLARCQDPRVVEGVANGREYQSRLPVEKVIFMLAFSKLHGDWVDIVFSKSCQDFANEDTILENIAKRVTWFQFLHLNWEGAKKWPSGSLGFVDKSIRFDVPNARVIIAIAAGPDATAVLDRRSVGTNFMGAFGVVHLIIVIIFDIEGGL